MVCLPPWRSGRARRLPRETSLISRRWVAPARILWIRPRPRLRCAAFGESTKYFPVTKRAAIGGNREEGWRQKVTKGRKKAGVLVSSDDLHLRRLGLFHGHSY